MYNLVNFDICFRISKTDYNTFQKSVFKELISLQKSKFDFRQAYEPTYMITTNIPEVQF